MMSRYSLLPGRSIPYSSDVFRRSYHRRQQPITATRSRQEARLSLRAEQDFELSHSPIRERRARAAWMEFHRTASRSSRPEDETLARRSLKEEAQQGYRGSYGQNAARR